MVRFFLLFLLPCAVLAKDAPPAADDPALEKRVLHVSSELRCLVCQNQTLAESNAPLAMDLRHQIRSQLAAGKSEREVLDYLVARYGDFVRYRPPLKASTLLLWAGPFVFLEMLVFVAILAVGFIYAWVKGDLDWVRATLSSSAAADRDKARAA